jgi:dolichol-phosphate mannosyltransferase
MLLSVVSPIYKGEKMMEELVSRIEAAVNSFTDDYEIILVNDCSPDDSWRKMQEICAVDKKVKGLNLSRNFGQHYAITAGLSKTKGEWVVVMDCDLQDVPEEIPNLYFKAQEGYDTVFAQRTVRQDTFFKKLSSASFHYMLGVLTGTKTDKSVANFGIYNRKVIQAVLSMGDAIRNFPSMVRWVGFKQGYLPVKHAQRAEGTSGYNFFKLIRLAENTIINFSNKPLLLVLRLGFMVVILSMIIALFYLVSYLLGYIQVSGFTTLIISVWLIGGLLMSVIGVVGLYISKIFDRVKGRPIFIIGEELNFEGENGTE